MELSPASVPVEVQRVSESKDGSEQIGTGLNITWSSGEKIFLSGETLRKNCPCAQCRENRGEASHEQPLSGGKALLRVIAASASEQTNLQQVWPIGNYAIGISWGDNHDTGIYSFDYLRQLVSLKETKP